MKILLYTILKQTIPPILWNALLKIVSSCKTKKTLVKGIDKNKILDDKALNMIDRYTIAKSALFGKEINIVDNASYAFMKKEIFESEIYKFTSETKEPYIIDCGANIGLSSIYFKKIFPNARIVGFEPDPIVYKTLQLNILSFELQDSIFYERACWNEETTLNFYSEGADGGRSAHAFDNEKLVHVKTMRLKKYLNTAVDFLKIDIEGSEYIVLEDCRNELQNVKNIFVEYHSFKNLEQMLPEILNILKSAGFRLHISTPGLTSKNPFMQIEYYQNMDNQVNIYGFRI